MKKSLYFGSNMMGSCKAYFWKKEEPGDQSIVEIEGEGISTAILTKPAQCRKLAAWLKKAAVRLEEEKAAELESDK